MSNTNGTNRFDVTNFKEQFKKVANEEKLIRINGYIREPNHERVTKSSSIVDININYKYYDLLKESYKKLYMITDTTISALAKEFKTEFEDAKRAIEEMKDSVRESMSKIERGGVDEDDIRPSLVKIVNGVTEDKENECIYILGIVEREMILVPARKKDVDSKPRTLIKKKIMRTLPHNIRKFKIEKNELYKLIII